MQLEATLKKFIGLLERSDYFEAHEVLEHEWHELKKTNHPKANLARGLINAAVAFEHLKRATPTAMSKATKTYNGYLRYRYLCDGSEPSWNEVCKMVERIADENRLI
jgi:hypothetical protein